MRKLLALAACGALALGAAACGDDDNDSSTGSGGGGETVSGSIAIDGSSTVAPFAQAAQEAFQGENPDVKITVGTSGTGGGFEKFCAGETDISNASRPIKPDEEAPLCKKKGIKYSEVQVANDGIAVVTNKDLKVDCLTVGTAEEAVEQGLEGHEPEPDRPEASRTRSSSCSDRTRTRARSTSSPTRSTARRACPATTTSRPPTTTSSFRASRARTAGSATSGSPTTSRTPSKLNLVGIDDGSGKCVKPSTESIQDGSYKPLSRPLFMYPNEKALARPEVKGFMDYVIANYDSIAESSQIVPMTTRAGRQGQAGATGRGGGRRLMEAAGTTAAGARAVPKLGGGAPPLRRGRDQRHPHPRHHDLDPHHHGNRDRPAPGDARLLQLDPHLGLPLRQEVDAPLRAGQLRRAPAGGGHAPDHRHRPARGHAARPGRRPLPERVRAAARAEDHQADPGGARRGAHDRIRVLRAHLLHADGSAGPAPPRT